MEPQRKKKPADAEYLEGWSVATDHDHAMPVVEVFWYEDDRIRVRIPKGAPSVITGAYLEGGARDDVNLKIAKRDS
jgi:hypothetical protein